MRAINVIRWSVLSDTLTDNSKVFSVVAEDRHTASKGWAIKVDCEDEAAANALRDQLANSVDVLIRRA